MALSVECGSSQSPRLKHLLAMIVGTYCFWSPEDTYTSSGAIPNLHLLTPSPCC